MAGLGDLAQWLNGRGPWGSSATVELTVPPGDGPLILVSGPSHGLPQVIKRRRKDVRFGGLNVRTPDMLQVVPEISGDVGLARAIVDRLEPAAVLLADGEIPAALVSVCEDAGIPITLIADRHQIAAAAARTAWRGLRRGPLMRLSRVMVPDEAAEQAAMWAGIAPQRIEVIGNADPVLPPLRYNVREHAALRPLLANRHVWLAASLPATEAPAIMAAQRAVLSSYHRALLIVAPARPEDAATIAAAAISADLTVAKREDDEDPSADVQVLIAEDSAELGLWYRLAPVAYMGGSLIAGPTAPPHPFEPAGLGAAIVHGTHIPENAELWHSLDNIGATRRVRNAVQLGTAIEELGSPELAARLSHVAWQKATAGAEVSRRIADALLGDLPEASA